MLRRFVFTSSSSSSSSLLILRTTTTTPSRRGFAVAAAGDVAAQRITHDNKHNSREDSSLHAAPAIPNFINGVSVPSKTRKWIPLRNPATQELLGRVPESTQGELDAAVAAASAAFPAWRDTPVQQRQRVMFKLQHLIRERTDDLAESITREQGKTLADARGDVFRGLEVVEMTCGTASMMMGETVEGLADGVDTYSYKQPLGVCAGICPFNFPAMIPLWMFPVAATCGNTYILKPSEKDPGAALMLAAMAEEAGLPPGVLNIVHGTRHTVDYLCDSPKIKVPLPPSLLPSLPSSPVGTQPDLAQRLAGCTPGSYRGI
ncbi:hypothetical protein VYU27_008714 [Nannochloropsis oceanica]